MTASSLKAVVSWAVDRALKEPVKVANKPSTHCGIGLIDTREDCGPEKPIPKSGMCSAAYEDPVGWTACLDWKHDEPDVSQLEFQAMAQVPVTCEMLGASQLGRPWGTLDGPRSDDDWLGGLCTLRDFGIVIQQKRPWTREDYAITVIWIYSVKFIDFDEASAKRLGHRRVNAGL